LHGKNIVAIDQILNFIIKFKVIGMDIDYFFALFSMIFSVWVRIESAKLKRDIGVGV